MGKYKSRDAAVSAVTKAAKGETGYLEKKSNSQLDSKTANAGSANYTKYGKWIGMNGDYWCASFVSWCFQKAFGQELGRKVLGCYSASCEVIRGHVKKASEPKAGDVVFFSGTRHAGANHIGYVYKVSGGKIYTVEGNTSGASGVVDNGGGVAAKSYYAGNARILGYGRPDYSLAVEKAEKKPAAGASKKKQKYPGLFPKLPPRGYLTLGDGASTLPKYAKHVKRVQKLAGWVSGADVAATGSYDGATAAAVKKMQKKLKVAQDGNFGPATLKAAKEYRK